MINFCTLFDSNYLDKGLALHASLEKVCEHYNLFVFCFDDQSYNILGKMNLEHMTLIHHTEIETPQLLELKASRSKAEYCWTCTPVIIEYVLDNYSVDDCTYIDADLYFFHNPNVLYEDIRKSKCNIVITEHRFPNNCNGRKWLRKSGKYCVEFNYFDQSENGRKALQWWKEKCFEWCFALYEADRMGDQKYLEKFPLLFQGVYELQHLGGGVAPWNLNRYNLIDVSEDIILAEKENGRKFTLVFYHFQNIKYVSSKVVNINSGTNNKQLKQAIYYPYLKTIEQYRNLLKQEYGMSFNVNKSYSSNKAKAFIQKYIMKYKIKSLTDIINLDELCIGREVE